MIPITLETRGLTCPDGEVLIPECVAVSGPTGAGKTTRLRAIAAALFGDVETLRRHDAGTALARLTFEHNGDRYRIARTYRGSKRGVTFERDTGAEWTEETRTPAEVVGFDAESGELAVFLFGHGVDGLGAFQALRPAARRAALAEWVGVDRYTAQATEARQRATAAERDRAVAEGQLRELSRAQDVDAAQLATPIPEVPQFDATTLDAAEAEHAAAVEQRAQRESARREHNAAIAAQNNLDAQRPALEAEIARVEGQIKDLAERAARLSAVDAEVQDATEIVAGIVRERAELRLQVKRATDDARSHAEHVARLEADVATADGVPCGAAEAFAGCPFLAAAIEARGRLPAARTAAASLADQAERLAEGLVPTEASADADRRLDRLREERAALARECGSTRSVELERRAAAIRAQLDQRIVMPPEPGPAVDVEPFLAKVAALRRLRDAHLSARARAEALTEARGALETRVEARKLELVALAKRVDELTATAARERAEEVRLREAPGLALEAGLAKTARIANRVLADFGADLRIGVRFDGTKTNPKSEVHLDYLRDGERVTACEGEAWLAGLALAAGLGAAFGSVEWIGIDGGVETVKGDLAERLPGALGAMPVGLWVCTESAAVAAALGNVIRVGA